MIYNVYKHDGNISFYSFLNITTVMSNSKAVLGSPFLGKGNDSFIWGGGNSPFFVDGEGSRVGEREYFFFTKV